MISHYVYNVCKFKKWKILLFVVGICVLLLNANIILRSFYPSVTQLTELHKCPACYGISACRDIHEVDLLWHDRKAIFSHLFGVKNVFFGTYNRSKVVLKKLAHSFELNAFDVALCEKLDFNYPCSNIPLDRFTVDFYHLIEKTITSDFSKDDSSRLRLCPIVYHLDDLLHNVYLNNKNVDSTEFLINLWTLVSVNPEPLILQILSAKNGWPVPEYFGACGRIIIEEYVGAPLSDYHDKPWLERAKVASSLLNAAHMFTFRNEQFGFYLTDISYDNIAVDYNNVAKFIDLENIIIVDKNPSRKGNRVYYKIIRKSKLRNSMNMAIQLTHQSVDRPEKWQELHENTMHLDCPNCFAFSAEDICNHHLSDHNYYAICQIYNYSFCLDYKAQIYSRMDFFTIYRLIFSGNIRTSIICCNSASLLPPPTREYFLVNCSR
ncbi:deleted in autism protein 1 homolog isoform X2 [Ooceraea biroi]|uniref:deleted in autism protein 1 homolog isoform X2 n=1 Tax=Ooceraea biroi TaxID=2015173 RepID=UPI000F07DE16|nr:deleted in autism protein 1 homolog isoform X2 [Ooceraea biroi]